MKETIELPVEISTKELSLYQIGAITVLMTYPHIDEDSKRRYSKELEDITETLSALGILTMEDDEMVIDLSDKEPKPYFEVGDWDDNDNPIYSRVSMFSDGFNEFVWRVKPILWDMKILWKNCSDADIRRPNDEEVFDSLEDAEAYFREEDKKSLNYGSK